MKSTLTLCLLALAFVPCIIKAQGVFDSEATGILDRIRGDVQEYQRDSYNQWALVSYKKKQELGKTIFVFKVRTDKGYLKVKVVKKWNGVTLASVKRVKQNDILDFL